MNNTDQKEFDLLLPPGDFVTPKELAAACGFSVRTIIEALDDGQLSGFRINGCRNRNGGQRLHTRIPREIAVLFLVRNATYDRRQLVQRHLEALERRTVADLLEIAQGIRDLVARKQAKGERA